MTALAAIGLDGAVSAAGYQTPAAGFQDLAVPLADAFPGPARRQRACGPDSRAVSRRRSPGGPATGHTPSRLTGGDRRWRAQHAADPAVRGRWPRPATGCALGAVDHRPGRRDDGQPADATRRLPPTAQACGLRARPGWCWPPTNRSRVRRGRQFVRTGIQVRRLGPTWAPAAGRRPGTPRCGSAGRSPDQVRVAGRALDSAARRPAVLTGPSRPRRAPTASWAPPATHDRVRPSRPGPAAQAPCSRAMVLAMTACTSRSWAAGLNWMNSLPARAAGT